MWQKVLIQGIGFVAAALLILSFQCRNSRKLFFLQMCSSMTYVLHFFLLNALSGCANLFCSIARSFVFSQRTKKWAQWKGWLFLLVLANVAATALTWENALSILPFLGTAGKHWTATGKKSKRNERKRQQTATNSKLRQRRSLLRGCQKRRKVCVFGKEDSYERNPGGVSFVLDQ